MKSWVDDCRALNLTASDFKGSVASWVEYHAVMHVLTQWDRWPKLFLGSDGPIREVAREVTFLRNRINETVAKVIEHQFRKGANHIKHDPVVHSFKQEFLKTGKRKKTLRQLYHRHGQTMTRLFPVHLTTPEVVCNLFEGKDKTFDLVIFDEASGVELHDAVTCLLKGTSIVVAGDEHQMPPATISQPWTDHLFEEDEEEMEGAIIEVESLLEFCQQDPGFSSRYLDFHYRSQHPLLIQFSNRAIYSRLVVKPNPTEYVPIQFVDVQGVWDNQHNSMEAERVIDILRPFLWASPPQNPRRHTQRSPTHGNPTPASRCGVRRSGIPTGHGGLSGGGLRGQEPRKPAGGRMRHPHHLRGLWQQTGRAVQPELRRHQPEARLPPAQRVGDPSQEQSVSVEFDPGSRPPDFASELAAQSTWEPRPASRLHPIRTQ